VLPDWTYHVFEDFSPMSAYPFPCCRTTIVRLLALCALLIAERAVAAPVVSNLSAAQRAGTKLVDIQYDLVATGFATVAVSLEISSDGGVTWTVPAKQRDAPATLRLDPTQSVIFPQSPS
jgi:hypothetical protein